MSGHAIINLPTGRVEVWNESPDTFSTDREITQAEYDTIHDILQRQHEARIVIPTRVHEADESGHVIDNDSCNWPHLILPP